MIKKINFVILIISVFYFASILYYSNLAEANSDFVVASNELCIEGDYGRNYFKNGYIEGVFGYGDVNGIWGMNADFCTNDKQLTEFYCSDNKVYNELINCEYGCKDGFCLNSSVSNITDLALNVSYNPTTPAANEQVEFTLTITNNGPADAENIYYEIAYNYDIKSEEYKTLNGIIASNSKPINKIAVGETYTENSTMTGGGLSVIKYTNPGDYYVYALVSKIDNNGYDLNYHNNAYLDKITVKEDGYKDCSDTDGGDNIFIKGTVSLSNNLDAIKTDQCIMGENTYPYPGQNFVQMVYYDADFCDIKTSDACFVKEWSCLGHSFIDNYKKCENGCRDGVCIKSLNNLSTIQNKDYKNYRYSKFICYDGTTQDNKDDSSCKSSELWKKYGEDFCKNKCKDEKCGMNTFLVENECEQDSSITKINDNSNKLFNNKFDEILAELKELKNLVKEQQNKIKYLEKLLDKAQNLTTTMQNALNNFITYGVDSNTQKLGEGERAAVINSYKSAFNKLPETEAELADAIKIANGRWPSITNDASEKKAKEQFQKIYKRIPDMNNANDNAAVTVMAYGLRQKAENRNLNSEKAGIKTFKGIYGHTPQTTEEWNIMQAITYSGSSRGIDSDGDLLTDEREAQLGTDPRKKDSDGDGYVDGIEVANGYNPLGEGKLSVK